MMEVEIGTFYGGDKWGRMRRKTAQNTRHPSMKEGAPVQGYLRLGCRQASIRARSTQGNAKLGRPI
jgi:hypothetical protein